MSRLNINMEALLAKDRGKAVLVIDDSTIGRQTVRRNLEYYGFTVLEAAGGQEGVDLFGEKQQEISLVLLDTGLSGTTAKEVLAQLQAIDAQIRIVLCTTQSGSNPRATGSSSGVVGVIRKPVQIDRLLKMVSRSLGEEK